MCHAEFLWTREFDDPTEQEVWSVEEAYSIVEHIAATESEPAEGDEPAAWATVVFRRSDDARIQVGQSDVGWLAALVPMFILAGEIDGDEWAKATTGAAFVAMTGVIITVYKLWKGTE
jgi:hypothetical protein